MKKWLIPLGAVIIIVIIALLTKHFVLNRTEAGTYKIYMVAVGDNGKQGKRIGCGDSLVAINMQTVRVNQLFDVYQDVVGVTNYDYSATLKNPVAESKLDVSSATAVDDTGTARVYLTGNFSVSGTCDGERVQAQLEQPAYQFPGVKRVAVFINGIPLDQVLKQQTGQ
jgi:predicted ABC-type sugar transport system permease subunit